MPLIFHIKQLIFVYKYNALLSSRLASKSLSPTTNHIEPLFSIAEVNRKTLVAALESDFSDFEDAVLYQAGVYAGVNGFVTRNIKDFTLAEQSIYTPSELCGII